MATEPVGFSWKGMLTETGTFAAADAGIGAVLGAGPAGALIGGAVGAATGAVAYLASTFAARAVQGWGASPETAHVVQRAVDLAVAASSLGGIAKEGVSSLLGVEMRETGGVLAKWGEDALTRFSFGKPETAKLAMKAGATGLMTYYIVEPYFDDPDTGPMTPVGLAALAATGVVASNKLAWLGDWAYASLRRTLAENEWPVIGSGAAHVPDVIANPSLGKWVKGVAGKKVTIFDPMAFKDETPVIFFEKGMAKEANAEVMAALQPLKPLIDEVQKMTPDEHELVGQYLSKVRREELVPEKKDLLAKGLMGIEGVNLDEERAATLAGAVLSAAGAYTQQAKLMQQYFGAPLDDILDVMSERFFQPIQRMYFKVSDEALAEKLSGKQFASVSEMSRMLKEQGVAPEEIDRMVRYGHNMPEEGEFKGKPTKLGYRESKSTMLRGEWVEPLSKKEHEMMVAWVEKTEGNPIAESSILQDVVKEQSQLPVKKQNHQLAFREKVAPMIEPKTAFEYDGKMYRWVTNPKTGEKGWWRDTDLGVKFGKMTKAGTVTGQAATVNLAASMFEAVSDAAKSNSFMVKMGWLQRAAEEMGVWSDVERPGLVNVDQYLAGKVRRAPHSFAKPFGVLSNGYVSGDIARVAEYYANMDNYVPPLKSLAKLNRWYKKAYLALNHKTWVNVFLGNIMLTHLNGVNPFRAMLEFYTHVLEENGALAAAEAGGKTFADYALENGVNLHNVKRTQWNLREIADNRKLLKSAYDWDKSGKSFGKAIKSVWNHTVDPVYVGYAGMHDMFRIGTFRIKMREYLRDGMTADVAASKAANFVHQSYGFFDDTPIIVRQLRDTIWPFLGFYFRLFPQVVKAAAQYPERFMFVAALNEGLQRAAFKEQYGKNWADALGYERLANVEYLKPHIGGIMGHFVKIPKMGDLPGGYIYTGFMPWNLPISTPIFNASGDSPDLHGLMSMLVLQSPIIRLVSGLIHGTDPSSLRRITDMAGPGRMTASYLQYAFKTIAPSPFGINHWMGELLAKEGWLDPVVSWFNYYGTYPDGTPVAESHMLFNMLLPTVMKYDPDYNLDMAVRRIDEVVRSHKSAFYRSLYRNAPEHTLVRNWDDLEQVYSDAWDRKMKLIESYSSAMEV